MDRADLLLEIGTEEIPSGYFKHILALLSFKEGGPIKELFESQHIGVDNAFCYSTPRRIILYIKDIPTHQDIVIEGPPKRIAFDKNREPTKALKVFLEKNRTCLEEIEIYEGEKEKRIRLTKKDVPNKEILKAVLPKVIKSLDFPKTMRWNEQGIVFARPIRWLLALFGNEVLKFSLGGIESSNITYGHRFLGRSKIKVKDVASYFKQLERNYVTWDNQQRKEKILSFLQKKNWYENEKLLEEVNNLIEYPHFIEGIFKEEYLELPKEVLLASMSKHQRIFCLKDKIGELNNRFVAVINGKYRGLRRIRRHYEAVLDARLKDALFFYKSDTKRALSEWTGGLSGIVFHKQLGTLKDKMGRVKNIASFLAKYIKITGDEKKDLIRAVSLCKGDLLTQMVREFPSLQGVMGGYYALASGENEEVAKAIGEHYLPRFADDILPETTSGAICSLSDKFDNIICYFKIGKFPKGNWDLYALRRQGIGIISIILKKEISLSLAALFDYTYDIAPGEYNKEKLKSIFLDFFKERFISFIKERFSYRYDLLESVITCGVDDLQNCFLRLESLNSIINRDYFEKARCVVERTHNITRSSKVTIKTISPSFFKDDNERSLYDKYKSVKKEFENLCSEKEYQKATELYGETLFDEIHSFFEEVLVNVDDRVLKGNRLALLLAINKLYVDNIADLSKIVK